MDDSAIMRYGFDSTPGALVVDSAHIIMYQFSQSKRFEMSKCPRLRKSLEHFRRFDRSHNSR